MEGCCNCAVYIFVGRVDYLSLAAMVRVFCADSRVADGKALKKLPHGTNATTYDDL